MRDPYEVLGINPGASDDEIRKAYKKKALKHHPDKNKDPDSMEKFKEISGAYSALTSRDDKQDFPDIFSMFMGPNGPFAGPGGQGGPFGPNGMFFNMMKPSMATHDIYIDVSLEELYEGLSKTVEYTVDKPTGKMNKVQKSMNFGPMGPMTMTSIEPETIKEKITTVINVPAGYDPSKGPIVISGVIPALNASMKDGNVNVYIRPKEHPVFKRVNSDLHCTLDISLKEALLGFSRTLTYLDQTNLIINSSGIVNYYEPKVLKNYGFKNGSGSLIINFNISFPKELTDEQKISLKDF